VEAGTICAVSRQEGKAKDLVFALPDIAKLLWRVIRDERVSRALRGGLLGVGAYLALPFDVIPDWIPVVGQLDDFVVLTLGVRTLLRRVPEPILREHWDGEHRTLEQLLGRPVRDPSGNGPV
jgi:uncharacterized membrane protein YkvA (DUF1232 family)